MQTSGKAVQAAGVDGLSQLKRRFERWRAGREVGQRIPSQLWDDAVGAVAGHGAYRVARELNLDYAVLKRRAAQAGSQTRSGGEASPRFIELFAPAAAVLPGQGSQASSQAACVVEMANARGARMRVELRGEGLHSLPALCTAFWSA
jgi:hypothetical protein